MGLTSGVDVVLVIFQALSPEEQEAAYQRLIERRPQAQTAEETELEKYVRSLRRVAEALGEEPDSSDYKRIAKQLREEGEDVESFSAVYNYFGRSWKRAREALFLSGETSTRVIESRFAKRKLGMNSPYPEEILRETLAHAVEHYGRPPNTGEYAWWREQQIALAHAQGDENPQIPTDAPYRGRWKAWDAALLHFGYTPEQLALRDEQSAAVKGSQFEPFLPAECPIAELSETPPEGLPLRRGEAECLRETYEEFAARTRYVLTVSLGLGGTPKLTRGAAAKPLGVHSSRILQIQLYAIDAIAQAIEGRKTIRPGLRDAISESLPMMAERLRGGDEYAS
jgi:hypothetical protein